MGSQGKSSEPKRDSEWVVEINKKKSTSKSPSNYQAGNVMPQNSIVSSLVAIIFPILFPLIHMLAFMFLWADSNHKVDKKSCTCSCWDTVFKGPYETGIARFKHVYFNSTWNSFKMWTITVLAVVLLYESFKRLIQLALLKRLRRCMALLFITSLHSHYYAWWAHWNYWNDDFYPQWDHQLLFTATEALCTAMVLISTDSRRPLRPLPLLLIANISLIHIFSSGWDQFVFTVLEGRGRLHQVLRDLSLMSTDLLHTAVAIYFLWRHCKENAVTFTSLIAHKKHATALLVVTSVMYISMLMFPSA